MTIYRNPYAPPVPATPASATVRLADAEAVLDKHIKTFASVAGGYRTMLLLRAIRVELGECERVTP